MNKITRQLVHLIIKITVMMTSFYVIARNAPPLVGSFRFSWAPISLIAIFLMCSSVYKNKAMLYLMLYGAISLALLQYTLWNHMSDWHRTAFLDEFYSIFVFSAIFFYYYETRNFRGLASLGKLSFYFIIITLIMTNVALFLDPMIVRKSASGAGFTSFQAQVFNFTGAAGYGYAQALIFLIPILIYHIKFDRSMVFRKPGLQAILFILFITLLRAKVLANILTAAIILIFSILGAKRAWKSFTIMTIVTVIFLIIPLTLYADFFYFLSSLFNPESLMYDKFRDMAFFFEFPEFDFSTSGAGGRMSRYPFLFENFINNPLFGAASNTASSANVSSSMWTHLYWMYKLAMWGLPGFLFFIFALYQLYTRISSLFNSDFKFYYFLSVFAFILLGLIKNVTGREPFLILIVVIPGLYFSPLLKQRR